MKPRVLICDDDELYHLSLKKVLRSHYDCISVHNTEEARSILKNKTVEALVLDVQMRTENEGVEFIPVALQIQPNLAIVMASGVSDFEVVRLAMKSGATDYLLKDSGPEAIDVTIGQALEQRRLKLALEQKDFEITQNEKARTLIGESNAIKEIRRTIEKLFRSNAHVLITGETGVGKEIVARSLRSRLPDGTLSPFVTIDSSTIMSSMAESLLFGHEKGAFTGAETARKGIFEEANGGTVYFDEIGNMPIEIQAKLLRVIQEKEIVRLGSNRPTQLEFRVVAATNKDLPALVSAGKFLPDLVQRIHVIPIRIPPLRERMEDLPALVEYFCKSHHSFPRPFTGAAIHALKTYDWPGNIRELSNVIAYTLTMSDFDEIDISDLPPQIRDSRLQEVQNPDSFYGQIATVEAAILKNIFQELDGNIRQIALKLKMDRSHLYTKLKAYGIHSPGK